MEKPNNPNYHNAAKDLAGLIYGVALDGVVTRNEYAALKEWCNEHEGLCSYGPFEKLYSKIRPLIDSGKISVEELDEIEETLDQFLESIGSEKRIDKPDQIFINGMFKGILSSGDINDQEVYKLKTFLELEENRKIQEEYTGLYELIKKVWADGKVDDQEFRILKDYLNLLIKSH
ncbi:hypothetical protein OU792_09950 [Algoriphagus sp. NF]|jgi:hypothetical protein|uniref:Tellurite resistance protein TerB n=1 Tax=Algoriphagus marincola TaxID=264027 RepID=A0ABS7N3K8_9BACT|nr:MULTISPECIES: hypothetical protein [Algoriphagus]MBY5950605.1 hypothetical protein [Algoriphagus marincola]MCR9081521.1 hypothetical protein [Cyclobacteriaceae bacterium]MDE0560308.1 hypothetical protein [Algoriphagus sp. NF]